MGSDLFSITFSLSLSGRKLDMTTIVDWNSMLTSSLRLDWTVCNVLMWHFLVMLAFGFTFEYKIDAVIAVADQEGPPAPCS